MADEQRSLIQKLLQSESQAFIHGNAGSDPASLMLKFAQRTDIPVAECVDQIRSRAKAKLKLPTLWGNPDVLFPKPLSVEQSSSEITSTYKSSLFSGKRFLDLTGGFGVDAIGFARQFEVVDVVERNSWLCELMRHNAHQLGLNHIKVHQTEAEEFLKRASGEYDLIFIDPARRSESGAKVFRFEDCSPNIIELRERLLEIAPRVLVKASPMVDIAMAMKELEYVHKVWVVGTGNEVKEVLFELRRDATTDQYITPVELNDVGCPVLDIPGTTLHEEKSASPDFGEPETFLYEPWRVVLKAGFFKWLSPTLGLKKLHPHSHLYTSKKMVREFPGLIHKIEARSGAGKKELKALVPGGKANIKVRNYPATVAEIRKKTGIKDGGDLFLFFTTVVDGSTGGILTRKVS